MQRVAKNTIVNSGHLVGSQTNGYEVNRRSVLALHAFGQGSTRLSTFCRLMDIPQLVSYSNYDVCETVAENSMSAAVTTLQNIAKRKVSTHK